MFSFILNQPSNNQSPPEKSSSEDDIYSAEAIQGDMALILRVKELNALIECTKAAA